MTHYACLAIDFRGQVTNVEGMTAGLGRLPGEDRPRLRVLLVEDESLLRAAVARALSAGVDVTVASDVPEALALLAAGSFDAIISDHNMPGGLGVDLLAVIEQTHPSMLRILVSGVDVPSERDLSPSWHHFFAKPYPVAELLDLLARHRR